MPGMTAGSLTLKFCLIVMCSTGEPCDICSSAEISERELWETGNCRGRKGARFKEKLVSEGAITSDGTHLNTHPNIHWSF